MKIKMSPLSDLDRSVQGQFQRQQGIDIFLKNKMASLAFLLGGAAINALAFSGTNYLFSNILSDHGAEERKRHDLAIEEFQKDRDEWNQERIERLDFINQEIRKRNAAINYFNDNLDKGMLEYYRMTGKRLPPLRSRPKLTDYYHPSDNQKSGELLFIIGGMSLVTYMIFKYMP